MIFDTHTHYGDEAFDTDCGELLGSLRDAGITSAMNVAASFDNCVATLRLVRTYDWMYVAQGIHPSETAEPNEKKIWRIEFCYVHERVKAVGETGLDYYWEEPDYLIQEKWSVRQSDLARRVKLPIIIHSRGAAKDTLDVMKAEKAGDMGGVIHCSSCGKEIAGEYLNMGFFLGIEGVVTPDNAKESKEVVKCALLKSLVLETDCPYLVPVPSRSERNFSPNLTYVVDAISGIKGVNRGTIMKVT